MKWVLFYPNNVSTIFCVEFFFAINLAFDFMLSSLSGLLNISSKIVSILSEVDKKIEEHENKKQKLEEIKKGLMQQLLTGKIRVL